VHVWSTNVRSNSSSDYFVHASDITPSGGAYSLTVQPGYVYTITTTTGQGKGTATSPAQKGFALPYSDNFDANATGTEAKYLEDWQGSFEVAGCGGGRTGQCVRQMSAQAPITWDNLSDPHAMIGDVGWNNYTVTSDVLLEESGYAELLGRANTQTYGNNGASGLNAYHLRVSDSGAWSILISNTSNNTNFTTLASGNVAALGTNSWHSLSLGFSGSTITAGIDGKTVGTANNSSYGSGQAGYATSQGETAQFDNLSITGSGVTPPPTGTGPLHAVGAGKCLDDPNSSTTGGTQQDIYTCSGGANQTWTYTSSGALTVTVGGQTLCLDANGQGTTNGTKAIIWSCSGSSNQQWNLNTNGTITGVQSGLCLDVTGASTANGALVELWSCNGGSNQQWTLG
jgi:hypothetical protein